MLAPRGATGLLRGRYRLLDIVGRGGMAVVYRARDEHLGRDVAVKLFRATATSPEDIERRETEVRMLGRFVHHGLVTLLDAGIEPNDFGHPHLFLVMELVEGEDLATRLRRGAIELTEVAQIGFDIAEALAYIHSKSIVHRDVKPGNILLARYGDDQARGRAKLTDFGIASLMSATQGNDDGMTMGTAAYLSPEQARGMEITGASDFYTLALVLIECLTGEVVFPGEMMPSAIARLVRDPVIPDDLPPAWVELLTAMTAREPADRPSAGEITQGLRDLVITELSKERESFLPG